MHIPSFVLQYTKTGENICQSMHMSTNFQWGEIKRSIGGNRSRYKVGANAPLDFSCT